MFTVGEFSQLAQVSKRLLRYYDQIGLLKPVHTDPSTGYRYYSAEQMPRLNRILALKDLGLTLEQIQRLLNDHISTEEMQGMLLLKKAEIEQQLQIELQRIRKIESRLKVIQNAETDNPINVVLKQLPEQPVLSTRMKIESFQMLMRIFRQLDYTLPGKSEYGLHFLMCHDEDILDRDMDLEFGRLVEAKNHAPVLINDDTRLEFKILPAVTTMATSVVKGGIETIHTGYADIGLWVEANGYSLAGRPREITLQTSHSADGHDLITEIQFPVELPKSV